MAKQIKVIKCPQCGSTEKTEIKPEHFKCKKCGTEYFLDSDDITITHKVEYGNNKPPVESKNIIKIALIGIAVFFGIMLLSIIIPAILKPAKQTRTPNAMEARETDYSFYNKKVVPMLCNGKFYIVRISERSYYRSGNDMKQYFCEFINVENGKIESEQQLNEKSIDEVSYRHFSNGHDYFIINEQKIYEIDPAKYQIKDVTEENFAKYSELSSGISFVEFIHENDGEGFRLVSNMGKQFYYLSPIDKLYEGEFSAFRFKEKYKIPANTIKDSTIFYFAYNDKVMHSEVGKFPFFLMKSVVKVNTWGVYYHPRKSTGYYEEENGKIIPSSSWEYYRNWQNVTPARSYFYSSLLYYDKANILIGYRAVANENTAYYLQLLNAQDYSVIWTKTFDYKDRVATPNFEDCLRANGKYLMMYNYHFYCLIDEKTGDWKVVDLNK